MYVCSGTFKTPLIKMIHKPKFHFFNIYTRGHFHTDNGIHTHLQDKLRIKIPDNARRLDLYFENTEDYTKII